MKRIPLTQGKVAIVDDKDFGWLSQWKWNALKSRNTWYAVRMITRPDGKRQSTSMHRAILGLGPGDPRFTDHRNHNGLVNLRDNLRTCSHSQNMHNSKPQKNCSSKHKGVCWHKGARKWRAQIRVSGIKYYLGLFASEIEAAKAYDVAAKRYFGEFALINFREKEKHNELSSQTR